jgi:hypothetical protein
MTTPPRLLRPEQLSPEVLLQHVATEVKGARELYVVMVDAQSNPKVYSCGNIGGMAVAALVLQDMATQSLRGTPIGEVIR